MHDPPQKRITEVDVLTRLILHIKPPNKYPGGDGQCQFPTLLYSSFHRKNTGDKANSAGLGLRLSSFPFC